jgi:hypothetical protein
MFTTKSALSAAAMTLLMATVSFAQDGRPLRGERFDANGMPTDRSTPAEQAETARINRQIGADNRAADDRANADNERYRSEQTQYQGQRSQYEGQLQNNRAQQAEYESKNARYNSMRDRYADERAAYRRGAWPSRYASWNLDRDASLEGSRVNLINGRRVGFVTDTSYGRNGRVTALLVRLDNNRTVWIDASDVRYNRANRVIMTNLDRNDLRRMADHRM